MRWISLLLIAFVAGCERPPEASQYIPTLSVLAAYAVGTDGNPEPVDPTPSDVCQNCNGTGKLGDGTVFVDCPMCEDGKVTEALTEQQCIVVTLHPDTIKALAQALRRELQGDGTPHPTVADPLPEVLDERQPRQRVFFDYDEAAKVAVSRDQPLLLTFSQPNCAPCVRLDQLQQTPAVEEMMLKFIQVKLDTSRDSSVLSRWSVRSTPTEIIRHNGREVTRQSGITTADPYLAWLTKGYDSALRVPTPR